jgi:hypothetical protein
VLTNDRTVSGRAATCVQAAVIAGWAPRSVSPSAAVFAREVVAGAAPTTPGRAKALLFAASKLAGFGERVGLELDAGVLLHASVIERFILTGADGVSPATRRTLRTNLRALARASDRYPPPGAVPRASVRSSRTRSPRSTGSWRSPMRSAHGRVGCARAR